MKPNKFNIVAVTQPLLVVDGKQLTADEFIAYCARVSNPSNQMNTLTAPKLIDYCIRNEHWSIFEMVSVVGEIETTRDIGRQILRHRSFSFQEFSQRYADPTNSLGFTTREPRLQDAKNRQNSIDIDKNSSLNLDWLKQQQAVIDSATVAYDWALENGIAKEQARAVLPEGLTISRMYMSGTLRSYIHWCRLRSQPGTQKEHRYLAKEASLQLLKHFPSLSESLYVES